MQLQVDGETVSLWDKSLNNFYTLSAYCLVFCGIKAYQDYA